MKTLIVIAGVAVTAVLAGCTVYEPTYSYAAPPRVAYVTPGTTTYVAPAYNAVVVP